MKSNELEQLKSQYYNELEKLNRIKELLNTEQLIEFIKLTNENHVKSKYEYIDYLKIMKDVLTNFKGEITSTNNIYVCIRSHARELELDNELALQTCPIEYDKFVFRTYQNIEDKRITNCYREQWLKKFYKYGHNTISYLNTEVNTMVASDFEKENIVLNPTYKFGLDCNNHYDDVRIEFFLNCMTMSQEESKQLLLKKYNRM